MNLILHAEIFAICRLETNASLPLWAQGHFVSITRTAHELSVVCPHHNVPNTIQCERGWRMVQVEGAMDLSLVGVLASLTKPLAEAGINLFALSTYDTDYLLVKEEKLEAAKKALEEAGHKFMDNISDHRP
jgi:uncharacterized protein